ncbi:nucleotidyltransferase family protein [Persicimonas caeni]|uniref:nucleotidyltransferase family protein n=1 Tax=Persicimonas caeni TaxID=2292766 RepID=UPI002482E544|nr:nucleotidyltransferase family protein [Persicimonas caeni]
MEGGSRQPRAPELLIHRAAERGVFPLIYRVLLGREGELPHAARRYWIEHGARLGLYRTELARVHEALEHITPVVVLKGEPLSVLLYGDPRLRNTTDLDLLSAPESLPQAITALAELGYRPTDGPKAKTWASNQCALLHETYGTLIELHWRIAFPYLPSPEISQLLRETIAVEIGDRTYRSLRPELLFFQLCYHFHQHRGFLKGLLDITGWIDRFESSADLDEIRAMADRLGLNGLIQWPLHVLNLFTGHKSRLYEPTADPFVRAWAAWTAAKLERDFIELRPRTRVERWLDEQSFGAKLVTSMLQGASMTVADGIFPKISTAVRPVIFGPHRLGRGLFGALERLGAVDRDRLYESRILG